MRATGEERASLLDDQVIDAEHARPELCHALEILARLVPVAEFIGHARQLVRDPHHHRVRFTDALTRLVRLLEQTPRRRRIARPPVQAGQLQHGGQQFPVAGGTLGAPLLDRPLEHVASPVEIAPFGEGLGLLTCLWVRR
ncbi:hypothetical protein KRMM14A1259_62140 [Krasilnikovia sp. MM14-A1259]